MLEAQEILEEYAAGLYNVRLEADLMGARPFNSDIGFQGGL